MKVLIVFFFVIISFSANAVNLNAKLFDYDEEKVKESFSELNQLENLLLQNPDLSLADIAFRFPQYSYMLEEETVNPLRVANMSAPGNFSSFWFAFSLSLVGSYFIYGAAAGPIAVAIVYFNSDKSKPETKKAIYGCLTGTVLGLGIRYLVSNL